MPNSLENQIASTLLPGMNMPAAMSKLFQWIEDNKLYVERNNQRVGFLCPTNNDPVSCSEN